MRAAPCCTPSWLLGLCLRAAALQQADQMGAVSLPCRGSPGSATASAGTLYPELLQHEHYKQDSRYLRVWLQYVSAT